MINFKVIASVVGVLLVLIGLLMFTGIPFSWYFHTDGAYALLWSGLVNLGIGGGLWFWGKRNRSSSKIKKREGIGVAGNGFVWNVALFI